MGNSSPRSLLPSGAAIFVALSLVGTPAEASINVGQVLVKHDCDAAVAGLVHAWLQREVETGEVSASPYWHRREGGRRVTVLPAIQGWAAVLEVVPAADRGLAAHLASILSTDVIWIEVEGASLSWRVEHRRGDEVVAASREPSEGFEQASHVGPMPLYQDVEAAAWRFLASVGVPSRLRLLGEGDVRRLSPQSDEADAIVARSFAARRAGDGHALEAGTAPVSVAERGESPPPAPDTTLPAPRGRGAGHRGMPIDLLRLAGEPSPAAIERLASTLTAIKRRHAKSGGDLCHLVSEEHRVEVYRRMAREEGRCQALYEHLLGRAMEDDARRGRHPRAKPSGG